MLRVAADQATTDIDTFLLLVELFGGLAIFLLGMDRMTEALRLIAGARMRDLLARLTTNRITGLLTGAGVTALVQSSSVTTVLVVGFVSSGLMSLAQSLSVIIGANVGTTVTAQVIAFDVTTYALLAVAVGFGVMFLSRQQRRQSQGSAVMGLGLVFFGMTLMGDAMSPLRTSETFLDVMAELENPLLAVLVAAAFTALVQSSSATTGIVIVLAQQGLITTTAGVGMVLGANVGTAVTALLAGIGKSRDAQRAAAGHVVFNIGGVMVWLPFVGVLTGLVERIGGPIERQIANAHTIFNVTNAVVAIAFVSQLARLVTRLLPDRPDESAVPARYLDHGLLDTPELALAHARLEIDRMARRTAAMLDAVLPAVIDGTRWELLAVQELDDEVDALHEQIIEYLGDISSKKNSRANTAELVNLMEAANNLEAAADIIETNLVGLGLTRVEQGLVVSDETRSVIEALHAAVAEGLEYATKAVMERDAAAARHVRHLKDEIASLERSAARHQAQRLLADAPERVATYRFEIDVIANLKRVHYFSNRTARAAAPRLRSKP